MENLLFDACDEAKFPTIHYTHDRNLDIFCISNSCYEAKFTIIHNTHDRNLGIFQLSNFTDCKILKFNI